MSDSISGEQFRHAQQNSSLAQFCVEVAAESMFTCSLDGVILNVNAVACERLEFDREELIGMRIADIDPNYPVELWPSHVEELRREGKMCFETQHRTKSGRILDVEVSVAYFQFEGLEYLCATVRDVTLRKQAESLLRLQHSTLARVASVSEELSETLNELCRHAEELIPDAIASVMLLDESDGMLRFEAGPALTDEIRHAFEPLQPGEGRGSCAAAADTKLPVIVDDTRCSPHWESLQEIVKQFHLLACWSLPILDERDQVLGTFAISHQQIARPSGFQQQVLETAAHMASIAIRRKRFEQQLRFAHEELAHVNRLSTVGEMASSLAHELNQPLAALANHAYVLQLLAEGSVSDEKPLEVHARQIREQAIRAGEIVNSVRNLIKKRAPQRQIVDLNEVIRESMILMKPELRHFGIKWRKVLCEDLPRLEIDSVQIQQVLVNLIRNAIDAMKSVPRHERQLRITTRLNEQGEFEIIVADSGHGLDASESKSVFDAFHTTKEKGMGMGLTISRSIAESHAGRLIAKEGNGRGAEFALVLPAFASNEARQPA